MNNLDPLPKFYSSSFDFGDSNIPPHKEEDPTIPDYADLWTVSTVLGGNRWVCTASDIPSAGLARVIALAAAHHQKQTVSIYGYSDTVAITNPDNSYSVVYYGESPR